MVNSLTVSGCSLVEARAIRSTVARKQAIEELRQYPQVEMPLAHRFQDGVYLREILMPAETLVVGHVHRTKHWNLILSGKALVSFDGQKRTIQAGDFFESNAYAQKWLWILEEMRFVTIHGNSDNEHDIVRLEERLLALPAEYLADKGARSIDDFRLSVNQPSAAQIT